MQPKIKGHLILIATGTILSALSLASILFFTNPYTGGIGTHLFFYISLFLSTLGVCTLIGIAVRQKFLDGLYITHLSDSFRQALFISFILLISFSLQAYRILFWWVELSLILFFTVLEAFLTIA